MFRIKKLVDKKLPYFLILPTFLMVCLVILYPLGYSFFVSLYDFSLLRPGEIPFIGLGNYVALFHDSLFWESIALTIYFVVLSILLQLLVGLGMALLLNVPLRGRGIVRGLLILPWALPGVIVGGMWLWIYHPDYGLINGVLRQLNILHETEVFSWLGSSLMAIHSVIFVDVWRLAPFTALMLLAGLATLPKDVYDASIIDGANALQRLRHVILPLLKPIILVVLIIRTIFAFQIFDIVYVLTRGGPGTSTYVLMYYIWNKGFNQLYIGYAAAAAYVMNILIVIFIVLYSFLSRKGRGW